MLVRKVTIAHTPNCPGHLAFNDAKHTVHMLPVRQQPVGVTGSDARAGELAPWLTLGCSEPDCPLEVLVSVNSICAELAPKKR